MIETFEPLIAAASGIDLEDADAAAAELERRLDPQGDEARSLIDALVRLLEAGKLAQQGKLPVRWGRVAKASEATRDFSIDVVLMNGAGPEHHHPRGEVNFCVATEGSPTFDGQPPGWVVMPAGSTHVPTVEGGTMLIVYLLPEGQIKFLKG